MDPSSSGAPLVTFEVVVFGTAILIALVGLVVAQMRIRRLQRQASMRESDIVDLEREQEEELASRDTAISVLKNEVGRLEPYSQVADAAAEATRLLADGRRAAAETRNAADTHFRVQREAGTKLMESARASAAATQQAITSEVEQRRADAREYQRKKRELADNMVNAASENASKIIDKARDRAMDMAGEALLAMENADRWERTETAMRNVVKGYGDAYLKPPVHVLDDLADDYDHKEAGRQLKLARKRSVHMVTSGRAALCDYVQPSRRDTAIRFVTDAFNGKAEVILTKVKGDNVGTLEQRIRDAFALVNHNGAAFRNARIEPEYLDARLDELRWAVATWLLRQQELEEQREIKARIREEQQAQREFERAMKEAAKEEASLHKAMEKAKAMLAKASEAQKSKYEGQLALLRTQLVAAEERNQRAVSMAQLTRSGHVYVISNVGSFGENVFKIGMTRRLEPTDRVRELGGASVPFRFDVHAMIYSEDAPRLEKALHHRFSLGMVNKMNPRKEFFRLSLAELRDATEQLDVDVHWTMQAEALEFRESRALDLSLETDDAVRQEWLARQARWDEYLDAVSQEEVMQPALTP